MQFNDYDIFGFDVSFWQMLINFTKMKSTGAQYVGVKAGQNNYEDSRFKYNWIESKKAGLIRFSYWFCGYEVKPKIQAQKYWDIIKLDFDDSEMCFADYEVGSFTEWYNLYVFMNEFQMLSGLPDEKVGVYTGVPYWESHRPSSSFYLNWFSKHPLFLAWYTSDPIYVRVPSPWEEVLVWQNAVEVFDAGQTSPKIDRSKFNGNSIKFKKYFGSSSPVVIPPAPTFPSSMFIGDRQYKGVA